MWYIPRYLPRLSQAFEGGVCLLFVPLNGHFELSKRLNLFRTRETFHLKREMQQLNELGWNNVKPS